MIYHFILNPNSAKGRSSHKNIESQIQEACRKRKLSYHIYYTTCQGDATEYVRSMVRSTDERQRFICIGGDGTINEIANSAPSNPNVEFGVIPNGSGNDFVRNFSNLKKFSDIDAQIDGDTISLDLIKCNDRYCVNMINIGFDCAVVKEADKLKKNRFFSPGLSYILGVGIVLFRKFGTKMRLIFDDGEVIDRELTLTAIGNGKFCGGGFKSTPMALLTDGIFDVCAIHKISRLTFLRFVKCYKEGTYLSNKKAMKIITHRRVNHLKIEFDTALPVCIDGEIMGARNVELTVVPKSFNFVIPKGSSLLYERN